MNNAKTPSDMVEAAALAMYGRGYGRMTDVEAERAAVVAIAVANFLRNANTPKETA